MDFPDLRADSLRFSGEGLLLVLLSDRHNADADDRGDHGHSQDSHRALQHLRVQRSGDGFPIREFAIAGSQGAAGPA